jgi:hypothetical protein
MLPAIDIESLDSGIVKPTMVNKGGRPKGTTDSPIGQLRQEVKATAAINRRIRETLDKALVRIEILMGSDPSLSPTLEILDGLANALDKTGRSMAAMGKMVLSESPDEGHEMSNEDLLKLVTK